jgi:hypothetical protein
MNCHKGWDYAFLSSQMTKVFLKKHKEHTKNVLMREIENGLGNYQEIAVVANQKEDVLKRLKKINNLLDKLKDEEYNHCKVNVAFQGRVYNLYHRINKDETPETRYGSLLIKYVETLANPPPTDHDLELAKKESENLTRQTNHFRFVYSCSVIDYNVFYTDKILASMSIEIPPQLTEEEKKATLEKIEKLRMTIENLEKKKIQLYEKYIINPKGLVVEFNHLSGQLRNTYQEFWKNYFSLKPPTPQDFQSIEEDKTKYYILVEENKNKMLQSIWDQEDVHHRLNSNRKYLYNLDDNHLYRVDGEASVEEIKNISLILEKEEMKWKRLVDDHYKNSDILWPLYDKFTAEFHDINKKYRNLCKKKTTSGNYIVNCQIEDCIGKLGNDGQCGLCKHQFCVDCMKEWFSGHECKKEDVDTVNELRKNTRPCPTCNIPIYKTEGCDQMWCVKCHTTFSWKTGAISQGVIHNPHFYHQRQQAMRTPGDIPCGGLPNELEIVNAIVNQQCFHMYDIWDYCDRISEYRMPFVYQKFHNVRPSKYRRYSIAYMRGKMDKKRLGVLLFQNYFDEIRYSAYYGILETFVDNMAEYMRQFVGGINTEKECVELLNLLEQDVRRMNKIYNMRERIDLSFLGNE